MNKILKSRVESCPICGIQLTTRIQETYHYKNEHTFTEQDQIWRYFNE